MIPVEAGSSTPSQFLKEAINQSFRLLQRLVNFNHDSLANRFT